MPIFNLQSITLASSSGDDSVSGTPGDDVMDAGQGNDTIDGGAGDDILLGQEGGDTYIFGPSWGNDLVIDPWGANVLRFQGFGVGDLVYTRSADDLTIGRPGSDDQLLVENFFGGSDASWQVSFDDGIVLTSGDVELLLSDNEPPVAIADFVAVAEDGHPVLTGNVLSNDTDPDGQALRVTNPGTYAGTHGVLVLQDDGSFTYFMDADSPAVQSLPEGLSLTDAFTYFITDDDAVSAGTSGSVLTVAIAGTNDLPVVTGETVALVEDGSPAAAGNVLANDTDSDAGSVLQVASAGDIAGALGNLHIEPNGGWTYLLRNASLAVQSLGRETLGTDPFAYAVSDSIATVEGILSVTVQGVNDAPVLAHPLGDQSAARKSNWSWTVPADTFTDVDVGDSLMLSAKLADGSALPSWLAFDPLTGTFSGRVPNKVDLGTPLAIVVTATDFVAASGSTLGSLSVSDEFLLFFTRSGNEGVGNGEEPPPPGHDTNQNDGPGTSPGHPGSKGGHAAGHSAALVAQAEIVLVGTAAPDVADAGT